MTAYLFRLIPSLCQHNISGLNRLVMVVLDLQEKEAGDYEHEERPTH
jgi:hypothetical protein